MASEKQSGKEKRLANNENTTEFKQSWCFNMVSCTRRTSIKRKSTKDDCKSNIRFDNISKAAEPQNGEVEPVKRKMPRRTKRFNMIRKTFTMCCTPDRDSSIDGDDVIRSSRNQEKNIRERNAEDTGPNHTHLTSRDTSPDDDNRTEKYEKVKIQSASYLMVPENEFNEECLGLCREPPNVLKINAADVKSAFVEKNVDFAKTSRKETCGLVSNEEDQNEGSVVSVDISSSLSSGDIDFLLDDENSDDGKLTSIWAELKKITDEGFSLHTAYENMDTNYNVLINQFDNEETENDHSNNQQSPNGRLTIDIVKNQQHIPCTSNTLRVFIQQIKDLLTHQHDMICPYSNANNNESNNDKNKSNGVELSLDTNKSVDISKSSHEKLYKVYNMIKGNKVNFEVLSNDISDNGNGGVLVNFKYSETFTLKEAKQFQEEIKQLVDSKAMEFKFSNRKDMTNKITISSFNGKRLELSQERVKLASDNENNVDPTTEGITDANVDKSICIEKPCVTKYIAVIEDVLDVFEGCIKKFIDYITTIRDPRFPILLKDILKAGNGEICSVNEYLAVLSKGEFTPGFDGIDDENANCVERYKMYISTIKESNFRKSIDDTLKVSKSDKYSLYDFILIIQDQIIFDLLEKILQTSKLPENSVREMINHYIVLKDGDVLDDSDENDCLKSSTVSSSSHEVEEDIARTLFLICNRIKMIHNNHKISSQNSSISFTDDAYSSLENIESSSSSKRKGQTSSKNTSDWSVSSPIVRPKQLGKSCATSSPANEIKNMQIKSIYKPSNRKPSGVAVTNVTKAKQPVQNHSGEIEVKQSKAQHALDHIGEQEDSKPAVNQKRVIKHARRRTRTFAKLENEPVLVTVEPDTIKLVKNDATPKLDKQIPNVASDVKVDIPKAEEAPPIFIETEATVDYGRCAVEPSYGEKPDKKKLRTGKKEKIKTKGQPNKHLMAKKENRDFDTLMDEYLADIDNEEESNDNVENTDVKFDEEVTKAPSPVVMNAVDQPQVLDDREFHLVPDEIKRVDDPFLEDVEEHYKLSTPGSNKKEKRKQKADRKKENRSRKGGQTVLKLA